MISAFLQKYGSRLLVIYRTFHLLWCTFPRLTLAWSALLLFQGLLPAAIVWLTRLLVDQLVVASGSRAWADGAPVLWLALALAGLLALAEVLGALAEWVRTAQSEHVQDHISTLIHRKSAEVDLAFYESPEYHDQLHRARDDAASRPLALLTSLGGLLQNGVTFIAMALVLLPFGLWLPLLLVASMLPVLWAVARGELRYHAWWQQTTAGRRRGWYYEWLLTGADVAAELRLFGLGSHFLRAHGQLREQLRGERLALLRGQAFTRLLAGALAHLVAGAALAWMVWRALQAQITLGDLALFYGAFSQGQSLMRALLGDLGQIYSNSLFLGNLFEFLALESQLIAPASPVPVPAPIRQGVRYRDVTFSYPGSARPALEAFNLFVPAGRVVAIVGANGAGKSTLLKLLCRFYDPDAGAIEIDGVDLRELAPAELRRMLSVLFQSPVPYHASAAENIALGDLASGPGSIELEAAARAAGAHDLIARLPQGYATQLGKWFADGSELSGGEWQRVALARAFLRQAPIIVLDEPTSAMDSWTEADWYDRFRALAQGRTALIITHRLTIARRADIVHVMHDGQIVESGSHAELLACGGRYAASWAAQLPSGELALDH